MIPELDIPRERFGYPSTLTGVELRASVCANGLFRGHLGGRSSVDDLVAQVEEAFPGGEETARSIIESLADLGPTEDEPAICDQVSVGYAFEGVLAQRMP